VWFAAPCWAAGPTATATPSSGPPTSSVTISGAGYGAYTAVDIYFDTTDVRLALANSAGVLPNIQYTIPANAISGQHWISLVERVKGIGAQVSFTVNDDWVERGFNALGKRFNSYETVLTTGVAPSLDTLWSAATGGAAYSSPAVANGVLYAGSADDNLHAFNAATGTALWSSATGSYVYSSPTVANGVVYVGSEDSKLYAFNAVTGATLWSSATGSIVYSSPTVASGVVYVGSADKSVYAFNATTGAKLWSSATGSSIYSSPAVANGVVYVGSADNSLYAFNAKTGAKLWSFATGNTVYSSPAVANGVVYVGSDDASLYAFAPNGQIVTPSAVRQIQAPRLSDLHPDFSLKAER
jgi:outer membrane protein assembly factor BamB